MQNTNTTIVISVGGSLIVPDQIDTDFLTNLKTLITKEVDAGRRFILIAGGGKICRRYQDAARAVTTLTDDDLDWLGIHATHLNGHLLRTIFRDIAYHIMIKNPDEVVDVPERYKVIIAGGYRPGASTDLRAIQIAERVGAKNVINLSNVDYVYTADPRKDETAQKIEDITWTDFRALIPAEWNPGLNSPFDPVAAKVAEEKGIEVAQINGQKLSYLEDYLADKPFVGTRMHN